MTRYTIRLLCHECAEEFFAKRADAKYCLPKCRMAASRRRKKEYRAIVKKNQLSFAL